MKQMDESTKQGCWMCIPQLTHGLAKGWYPLMSEIRVSLQTCARVPTARGEFQLCLYSNNLDDMEHLVLIRGSVSEKDNVVLRVQSECLPGDVPASAHLNTKARFQRAGWSSFCRAAINPIQSDIIHNFPLEGTQLRQIQVTY